MPSVLDFPKDQKVLMISIPLVKSR